MNDSTRIAVIVGGTILLRDFYSWIKERHGTKWAVLILSGIFIIFFGIASIIDANLKG